MYEYYDKEHIEFLVDICECECDGINYDKPLEYCFDIVTATNIYNLRSKTNAYSYKDIYVFYQNKFCQKTMLWLTGIVMGIDYYNDLTEHGHHNDDYLTISNINH
jgi:hypothetical protein